MIIGRNEGQRLEQCLRSLIEEGSARLMYVDSGSTDNSVKFAQSIGVSVVELDMSVPFTAGRARNIGFTALMDSWPEIEYVHFIDGDCEITNSWCEQALKFLHSRQDVGIVTGRLRERFRDATAYNLMADLEWDQPVGEVPACGGIFLIRVASFVKAGKFNPVIIAAEDDELCIRVRQAGWKIFRLEAEMAAHDVAMTKFSQWWRRSVRAGHAYAQVGHLHPEYFVSERRRTWFWGGIIPLVAVGLVPVTYGLSLTLFLLFLVSYARTRKNLIKTGIKASESSIYAKFLTISKFPALIGMLKYWYRYALKQENNLIEYK